MSAESVLTAGQMAALRRMDTCTVSNAIETFGVRLRNTGFANASVRCVFPEFPPLVGYAATARLRSVDPPIGKRSFQDRSDWWQDILRIPEPRIVVLQDMDDKPGLGAFIGDVHAAMLTALGCVGYVTNGAVRELPEIKSMGFHLFAGEVTVSHAYAHIFDLGATIEVGGLTVEPGDLLHGDRHGVLTVPKDIAAEVPAAAARLRETEDRIIAFCQSEEFSVDKLREVLKQLD